MLSSEKVWKDIYRVSLKFFVLVGIIMMFLVFFLLVYRILVIFIAVIGCIIFFVLSFYIVY